MQLVFDRNVNVFFNRGLILTVKGTSYIFATFAISVSGEILDGANSKELKINMFLSISID